MAEWEFSSDQLEKICDDLFDGNPYVLEKLKPKLMKNLHDIRLVESGIDLAIEISFYDAFKGVDSISKHALRELYLCKLKSTLIDKNFLAPLKGDK